MDVVNEFAAHVEFCTNPASVGYLLEYLVAWGLVSLHAGEDAAKNVVITRWPACQYAERTKPGEVCFPDSACGPDILYRFEKTLYVVQVKFVKHMGSTDLMAAWETTDPEKVYCKRVGPPGVVLSGYSNRRDDFMKSLEREGVKVKRLLFIHTGKSVTEREGVEIIQRSSHPAFFDGLNPDIWNYLDGVRKRL
jgi:hypothetical protein